MVTNHAVAPGQPPAGSPAPGRLLVVDDLEDSRVLIERLFARRGFAVQHADGGAQALEQIAAGGLDMVLLDIAMPEIDGLEVLARIRATHDRRALPVIMVSVHDDPESVRRAFALGANAFLPKPMDFERACACVHAELDARGETPQP